MVFKSTINRFILFVRDLKYYIVFWYVYSSVLRNVFLLL